VTFSVSFSVLFSPELFSTATDSFSFSSFLQNVVTKEEADEIHADKSGASGNEDVV